MTRFVRKDSRVEDWGMSLSSFQDQNLARSAASYPPLAKGARNGAPTVSLCQRLKGWATGLLYLHCVNTYHEIPLGCRSEPHERRLYWKSLRRRSQ